MAMTDYCECDACGKKAFYDSNVTDPRYTGWDEWSGKYLYDEEMVDFSCVCVECRSKYKTIVIERENNA